MKNVYPAFIKQDDDWFLVYFPDIDRMTQGRNFYDAIYMGRDLLGTYSLDYELPKPSDKDTALRMTVEHADEADFRFSEGEMVYIDIDTAEYRRKMENRSVKKNCTLPYWLNEKAEAAGINFSKVLQEALIEKLKQ